MIRNYFKVAWRNLRKSKSSSFINIGGLAVGMAVAILISLWIYDELSFDKYHKNYSRLGQVMQQQTVNGRVFTNVSIPYPLKNELLTKYGADFKYLVNATWQGEHILSYGEKLVSKSGNFMEPDATRLLSLKMITGTSDGLKDPNSILLSASTAKAIFGEDNAVNKMMKIDNKLDVKVTGVYEDIPFNAEFRDLLFIAPWDLFVSDQPWVQRARTQWNNNSFQLYVQIADNADYETVNKHIAESKRKVLPKEEQKYKAAIFINPMKDWHLRSNWENGIRTGGLITYVRLFAYIGAFVLLLACINFMNLSTARSEKRAKEVGIRKAIGSLRSQLIKQFFCESLLVVAFAFLLSILLVQLILPWFNEVAQKKMLMPWNNPVFWLSGLGFALLTGLIAGSYPALYLSSFQPIKVLKGTFRVGRFAALPRKILVVLQFTVSITLIIGTIIVYRQVQHTKDRPVGYNRNGLISIEMKTPEFYGKSDQLRNELKKEGAITELAQSSSPLTGIYSNSGGFTWAGKDPNLDTDFGIIYIENEFGKTLGWEFKEGRDFSADFPGDTSSIIVNEAAVQFMNLKNPVGTLVRWGDEADAPSYTIVGVVKDMITQSPYTPVKQTIYFLGRDANFITMRLNPNRGTSESIKKIESAFKKTIPSAPFEYKFADDEYAAKFAAEERVAKLAGFFAALAVLISCLGLFGLASFVAEQRTKEIGVRKVLGASVFNLWGLLSREFIFLVILSCIIAMPIAYYYLHDWLQQYQYRTTITWWVLAAAAIGAFFITIVTVSYQAIRAALANPIRSLRSE